MGRFIAAEAWEAIFVAQVRIKTNVRKSQLRPHQLVKQCTTVLLLPASVVAAAAAWFSGLCRTEPLLPPMPPEGPQWRTNSASSQWCSSWRPYSEEQLSVTLA